MVTTPPGRRRLSERMSCLACVEGEGDEVEAGKRRERMLQCSRREVGWDVVEVQSEDGVREV